MVRRATAKGRGKNNSVNFGCEEELWAAVVSGSHAAWEELVRRYQPLVYAVSTRAGLSVSDAADCFQQTWVSLYENRKSVRNPSRLSAWLVTAAKREALRLRRRAERESGAAGGGETVDSNPLPDEDLELLERQMHLEIAIKGLGPRCRKLVELFFFAPEYLTYQEIASRLDISSNGLGALRRRCLRRLKEILVRNGFWTARNSIR